MVTVHLLVDGPDRVKKGALDARAVEGIMRGYGTTSRSYLVWLQHLRVVNFMRFIYRPPESQRCNAEKLVDIDVTVKYQTPPRGARAAPLVGQSSRNCRAG